VATIQIRDIPEADYEVLRRRARAEGRSIQAYMLDRVREMASRPSKQEVTERLERVLVERRVSVSRESILEDLDADRR
jgi:hypothetical protein